MATFTENYSLIKPDEADYYDVADFNENMDSIDATLAAQESGIGEMNSKMGSPAAEGQTIFSLLEEGGGSIIKSIQHVTFTPPTNTTTSSCAIQTVDPAKSFVIMERLYDYYPLVSINYTLAAEAIQLTHGKYNSTPMLLLGFWVIEFI